MPEIITIAAHARAAPPRRRRAPARSGPRPAPASVGDAARMAQQALGRERSRAASPPDRGPGSAGGGSTTRASTGSETRMLSSAHRVRKRSMRALRVLGPLALVPVRQQQHEAVSAGPTCLRAGQELVDDHLRAVEEVAELRLPHHEARGGRPPRSRTRSPSPRLPRAELSCTSKRVPAARAPAAARTPCRCARRRARRGAARTCRGPSPGPPAAPARPRAAACPRRSASAAAQSHVALALQQLARACLQRTASAWDGSRSRRARVPSACSVVREPAPHRASRRPARGACGGAPRDRGERAAARPRAASAPSSPPRARRALLAVTTPVPHQLLAVELRDRRCGS